MAYPKDQSALVTLAQTGDPSALNRLLTVCRVDARRYAYRHCAISDVEDAVQEGLLIVARKLQGLKAAAAFSGWLLTVIKRECQRMRTLIRNHDDLDEADAQALSSRSDLDLRLDLTAALESLPAHYLQVVLLRDFEELTISEIAAELKEPTGAVKSRLHRARELVREYMVSRH